MGFNPLDPRDPRGFVAYLIVTDEDGIGNRPPQQPGGCGCLTLTVVAMILAVVAHLLR